MDSPAIYPGRCILPLYVVDSPGPSYRVLVMKVKTFFTVATERQTDTIIMSEKMKIKVELPDDTTLTSTEKGLITETWNLYIKKDITYHGCLIFIRYFCYQFSCAVSIFAVVCL